MKYVWLFVFSIGFLSCNNNVLEKAPTEAITGYTLDQIIKENNKFARYPMKPDTSFLKEEEILVVNKLIAAANLMTEIYLRQIDEANPAYRKSIVKQKDDLGIMTMEMYELHLGPWDSLNKNTPFWGDKALPKGAGFYPSDMTKIEFETYIKNNPEHKGSFIDPYTVISRNDKGELIAIKYTEYYKEWLEPAAKLLIEAANITSNKSLKKYLSTRAESFKTNDYFESDMAWMDLEDTPIEIVIGPYETYTDGLFGYKAAFEAFVTIKNPEESAKLSRYKSLLIDMEKNLPIDDKYKNFQRGSDSPIVVANQVHGGGDNVRGVQTIAFNLPNDERVREAKGSKKVILKNVMDAKFKLIFMPMAKALLNAEQIKMINGNYFFNETLFHELSHGLGPGSIVKDGKKTTVSEQLKELYSSLEEGKADVMGAYNILFLMDKDILPNKERNQLLVTYFTGIFRSMRFGIEEAHGKGAAIQYNFYKEAKAFSYDESSKKFVIDTSLLEKAIKDLLHEMLMLQANGDYDGTLAFFQKYALEDTWVEQLNHRIANVPVDLKPLYPQSL